MGLRAALGLKKHQKHSVDFRTNHVDAFDEDEPLRVLYRKGIQAAQDGRSDNIHKQMRYFILAQIAEQAAERWSELDFAECGCFYGHSTYMLASILGKKPGHGLLHVFDSFEGLSKFDAEDQSSFRPDAESQEKIKSHFVSDYEKVRDTLSVFDFVRIYKGWIPNRFSEIGDRTFSFVSIDVDMYQPTFDSIQFFYPRLAEGGLMYFDDYGYKDFPGARKAIDDYLATTSAPSLFVRLPSGSAFLRK
jgi:O-methyltransferase